MEAETVLHIAIGAAVICIAGLIVAYFTGHLKGDDRAEKQMESLAVMNSRSIVADFIQRGDYLHLTDRGFEEWMQTNQGLIFPQEKEAMERKRACQGDTQPHPRRN